MKLFILCLLVALSAVADDKKKEEPVAPSPPNPVISFPVPKNGAHYNQQTKEWDFDRGVSCEDTATHLLMQAVGLQNQLAACQQQKLAPPTPEKKSAPAKGKNDKPK